MRHGEIFAKKCRTCDRRSGLFQNHFLTGVDAVNLKDVLGDIETDRANLHVDGPL